jgi:ubiquinone/menaquinone biosynthesis C-methylase UbiE
METGEKEKIRDAVRERYGKLAGEGVSPSEALPVAPCCGTPETSPETSTAASCCSGGAGLSLEGISSAIGYKDEDIQSVPEGANMGLGCGNPVALASLKTGETIVDLGCGGGFDCFLASKEVGKSGKVIGVDMTPEMVKKARENAEKAGVGNIEFRLGEIEHLPVADNSADIIMSNCVINLSPDKLDVYRDAFRVLKPGGRLAISDIVATAPLPDEIRKNLALLTACIGGAATIEDTEEMLKEAGFQHIRIKPIEKSGDLIREWIPGKRIEDYVVSASIEAVKPSV